ncbi:MAG: HEAT repeat domain-containing protein [Verrucomicrobia bacterium]|nr:HEAT repeat domain-containing protein [Verrucomicrobiota bacterium]
MTSIIALVLVSLVSAAPGAGSVDTVGSAEPDLKLEVQCEQASGKAGDSFALNEPVWFSLSLRNVGTEPTSVWISGDPHRGAACSAAQKSAAKVKPVPQRIYLERNFRQVSLAPGEAIGAHLLLGEFLIVTERGVVEIQCSIRVMAGDQQPVVVTATREVTFTEKLDDEALRDLVKQLREDFEGGSEEIRIRMVRSVQSLDTIPEAVDFLILAGSTDSEEVQLTVVDVLSKLPRRNEELDALLRHLSHSRRQAVRRSAEAALRGSGEQ